MTGLLALGLVSTGCESGDEPPPREITFEEMNTLLARIDHSGKPLPRSVEELVDVPELQGMVLPELPSGAYLQIDAATKSVIIEMGQLPEFR